MLRLTLLLATFAGLLLAGCLQPAAEETDPAAADGPLTEAGPALPEPIEAQGTVTGSADPLNALTGNICVTPTNKCVKHPFTLETNATLEATLTWTLPVSDFDLYLYKGNEQVQLSGQLPPGTSEQIRAGPLTPGDYEFVIVPWAVTQDTFTLKATFS